MKLLAFDTLIDRQPAKQWSTLGDFAVACDPTSADVSSAFASVPAERVIAVVHATRIPGEAEVELKKNLVAREQQPTSMGFLLFVTGGDPHGLPPGSPAWQHATTRKFGTGVSLSELRSDFVRLVRCLEDAKDETQILAAWKEFDFPAARELVEILSPLAMVRENHPPGLVEMVRSSLAGKPKGWWKVAGNVLAKDEHDLLMEVQLFTDGGTGVPDTLTPGRLARIARGCL